MAAAAPVDEGKRLYREGDYEAAVEVLRPVVRRTPRDGNANYYLGASLTALGRADEADPYLRKAAERGVNDAWRLLALRALELYNVDDAGECLDSWRDKLTRTRKTVPEELTEMNSRLVRMRNMLDRVERIEILDSIVVPSADFFTSYRLSSEAGKILPPEAVTRVGAGEDGAELSVAYMPESRSEILWAQADTTGTFSLYSAGILDDGTLDNNAQLDEALAEGGSALFPFLMPDGVTLYFANNGENSLGGYDIFMTSRTDGDDGGTAYFQPQNIGMPYNSPYDDYMLAIDEASGLGWWATDRNQIPDSLTIYVFKPSSVRVNVEPSDPNLAALARLSDISLTRTEGVDYAAMLQNMLPAATDASMAGNGDVFAVDMGNGRVYTRLADFRNDRARSAMVEYLGALTSLRREEERLAALREEYRGGDTSVASRILDAEHEQQNSRRRLRTLLNNAVRLENNPR